MRTQLLIGPGDHGRPLTWEEFATAQGVEGYRYELIEGRLEVSPLPDLPHERLRDWVKDWLRAYGKRHPEIINFVQGPARVFVSEQAAPTAPEPDVAAYANFPLDRPLFDVSWHEVSPVLVVEVLSADSADKDWVRNRDLYLQVASVLEYWILDPRGGAGALTLTVYRRRGSRWQKPILVESGEIYTSPRNFPELRLTVEPNREAGV